jgi:hypothetical protein
VVHMDIGHAGASIDGAPGGSSNDQASTASVVPGWGEMPWGSAWGRAVRDVAEVGAGASSGE